MASKLTINIKNINKNERLKNELSKMKVGLEKEGLRVISSGNMAADQHPKSLGSKLTNDFITTDYSESLLELITPPIIDSEKAMTWLENIHKFTYNKINDSNLIWPSSMPCEILSNDEIKVADYGKSNIGKLKTVYRVGLGHRYGKEMQVIAGLHYNTSFSREFWALLHKEESSDEELKDFINRRYFDAIRNFKKYSWLLIYLFGASPVIDKSFLKNKKHELKELNSSDFYLPYATSLRMGGLGYTNSNQSEIFVCFNKLSSYIESLNCASITPSSTYEQIGMMKDGKYKQLSTSHLQVENEFYSTIRPKRVPGNDQSVIQALKEEGIEYLELRLLDINPFAPVGIDLDQMNFLDAFILFCLLENSPLCTKESHLEDEYNKSAIVDKGRDPKLLLKKDNQDISVKDWSLEVFSKIKMVAKLIDDANGDSKVEQSCSLEEKKAIDSSLTPSAKVLAELTNKNITFKEFNLELSKNHKNFFSSMKFTSKVMELLEESIPSSINKQKSIEDSEELEFSEYLSKYLKDRVVN